MTGYRLDSAFPIVGMVQDASDSIDRVSREIVGDLGWAISLASRQGVRFPGRPLFHPQGKAGF